MKLSFIQLFVLYAKTNTNIHTISTNTKWFAKNLKTAALINPASFRPGKRGEVNKVKMKNENESLGMKDLSFSMKIFVMRGQFEFILLIIINNI